MDEKEILLNRILELLETACGASVELLAQQGSDDISGAEMMVLDLQAVVRSVSGARELLAQQLEYAYTEEMLENIEDTLDDILHSLRAGDLGRAAMKTEFQLYPFLRQLKESFYFWGQVYPDKDRMDRYYREDFALCHRNPYITDGEAMPFRLSVVVVGYNHLDVTRQCVEQLLKETDFEALQAELILIDHGSTDGTLEYFESLGVGKVIHFKRNVRMNMFVLLAQICQGEFFAFVSNDVLVTRDWAEILLQCMESDPRIIASVPATPNISNLQDSQILHMPKDNAVEFVKQANWKNRSDPSRWNDRARLLPPLGMYRTDAVSEIGFADPYFYSMEFWDDDFSLRARRAGYRQIVCDDVACYHFGSVTGGEFQAKEGTLSYGRELFQRKHGVDAWGNGVCYDYQGVQLAISALPAHEEIRVLGLDCGFGDTSLQIGNELRRLRRKGELYQLTCQPEYFPDQKFLGDGAQLASSLTEGLAEGYAGEVFSCIYLGRDIGHYSDRISLFKAVKARLAPGGCFVFTCANPYYAWTINNLLNFSLSDETLVLTDPGRVMQIAGEIFAQVKVTALEKAVDGLEQFAAWHYDNADNLEEIIERLSVSKYYFVVRG